MSSLQVGPPIEPPFPKVRRRGAPRRLVTFSIIAFGLLALSGCRLSTFGQDPGATVQAQHENHLFQGFIVAGIAVGVIVFILIVWSIFAYRRKSDDMPKQTYEHIPLEITYTIIPIIIVIALFIATVVTENKVDAVSPNPAVKVTVIAYQWGWRFEYPNGVTVYSHDVTLGDTSTYPELVLPVGETTQITLKSLDVVHGFYVRDFNFSRYAQPGVTNVFDLSIIRTGTFIGQCTQFCGLRHDTMLFRVLGVTPSQYQTWYASQNNSASAASSAGGQS